MAATLLEPPNLHDRPARRVADRAQSDHCAHPARRENCEIIAITCREIARGKAYAAEHGILDAEHHS